MDNFSRKEILDLICKMKSDGVVLYGAGQRGKRAIEVLSDAGIHINAIADKKDIKIGNMQAMSLFELCKLSHDEVCIITPACNVNQEKEYLKNTTLWLLIMI